MKVTKTLLTASILAAALFSSHSVFAVQVIQLKPCELSGKIKLNADTEYRCSDSREDLVVAPETEIETQGSCLKMATLNNIELNNVKITSFTQDSSEKSENACTVEVEARSCIGGINVDNRGLGEDGNSGDVIIKCYSSDAEFTRKAKFVLDPTEATVRLNIENKG